MISKILSQYKVPKKIKQKRKVRKNLIKTYLKINSLKIHPKLIQKNKINSIHLLTNRMLLVMKV